LGHRALALRCEQRLASVHWIVFDDHVEAEVNSALPLGVVRRRARTRDPD
jgi:hypothetical protein